MKFDEKLKALIIDTETTGFDDPRPITVAHAEIGPDRWVNSNEIVVQDFNPGKSIEFDAMATHHIFDWDVADKPSYTEFELPPGTGYIIGHNIDYDWAAIGKPNVKRICTLALARHFWPDVSHKLGALVYKLFLDENDKAGANDLRRLLQGAHDARVDVILVGRVLRKLIDTTEIKHKVKSIEDLWEYSEMARVPTHMPFGKHRGEKISDIPYSYKTWLLKQPDVDEYLRKALLGG